LMDSTDVSIVVSAGPLSINPGDSTVVAFSCVGGNSNANWEANADTSQALYDRLFPLTGVEVGEKNLKIPFTYGLSNSRPNPVLGSTRIDYELPIDGVVSLKVYNIAGQLVRTLVNGKEKAGYKSVFWDGMTDSGSKAGGGIYFYRLEVNGYTATKKMVVLK